MISSQITSLKWQLYNFYTHLKNEPASQTLLNSIDELKKDLRPLFTKQKELENELQMLSLQRNDLYPIFEPITDYGDKNNYDWKAIEGIPLFDCNDVNSKLSHTWHALKRFAKVHNLSKTCVKMILFMRLRGRDAINFYMRYDKEDLDKLILILGKRFEKHMTRIDFEKLLNDFVRLPQESLVQACLRLEYIIDSIFCNKTEQERKVLKIEYLN